MQKLKEPYRQLGKGRPAYVLYLSRRYSDDPMQNQCAVFIYGAIYSTKKAMELLLEDDDLLWINDNKVQSETGIIIHYRYPHGTKTLRDIWNHEYSLQEMAWEHRPPYSTECKRFRNYRVSDEVPEKVERRRGAPRSSRQGMTPIADIALSCGVTAREARAAFRKAKIKKPPQGWAFPPDQVDEITKKLKEALGQ